ncbi:hypothetical protein N7466_011078 [Penicillium verhagenii]|uniref:uncharacterized protein n=1 Tax=Penicillium verhagenii TaxID=1562060 RepID=UPI0025459ADE|nr:uncharacterized protein N7466_011078 [Penicillium verhagenii]KAJ5917524.1 hypothetical protein N7466_011078 [Penicillium verhagenii]
MRGQRKGILMQTSALWVGLSNHSKCTVMKMRLQETIEQIMNAGTAFERACTALNPIVHDFGFISYYSGNG